MWKAASHLSRAFVRATDQQRACPGFLLYPSLLCVSTRGCSCRITVITNMATEHVLALVAFHPCGLSSNVSLLLGSVSMGTAVGGFPGLPQGGQGCFYSVLHKATGSHAPAGHWPHHLTAILTLEFWGGRLGLDLHVSLRAFLVCHRLSCGHRDHCHDHNCGLPPEGSVAPALLAFILRARLCKGTVTVELKDKNTRAHTMHTHLLTYHTTQHTHVSLSHTHTNTQHTV